VKVEAIRLSCFSMGVRGWERRISGKSLALPEEEGAFADADGLHD